MQMKFAEGGQRSKFTLEGMGVSVYDKSNIHISLFS